MTNNQQYFLDDFNCYDNWQDKFKYLIELGSQLPDFPEHLRTDTNRIKNCLSKTYFHVSTENNKITISGYSNAFFPAGLIALLKIACDGYTPSELEHIYDFIGETGLLKDDVLTYNRRMALDEMITKIL